MPVNRRYIPIHKQTGLYYTGEQCSPYASTNPIIGIQVADFSEAARLCASEVRAVQKRRKDITFREMTVEELLVYDVIAS
jgi:hypothetical protein